MATTIPPTTRPILGRRLRANLPVAELYEDAIRHGEGLVAADGPLVVRTGKHTGRSPQDKFIVDEPTSRDRIWWGPVNRPIAEAHYDRLRSRLVAYCAERDLYAQDLLHRRGPRAPPPLRVFTETAWASIFARNLFRRPRPRSCAASSPTSRSSASRRSRPTRRPRAPAPRRRSCVHLERMEIIIVGTEYAGEIKKSRLHGHELPACPTRACCRCTARSTSVRTATASSSSASRARARRRCRPTPSAASSATTSTAGATRGLFNFEGGCYAKTIRLSPMYEPDIFQTTRRFGTVLENVDLDPRTRQLDLDSERFTENTRGAYPLEFIGNTDPTGMTGQPRTSSC